MEDTTPIVDAPSKPHQRFRRTRIAVSVFFGVLTVALCVLWAASYWQFIYMHGRLPGEREIATQSLRGTIAVFVSKRQHFPTWGIGTGALDEFGSGKFDDPRMPTHRFTLSIDLTAFPLFIPTLIFAGLAGIPWVRTTFSLRTMLIATAVVAIVLGLGVWMAS